MPIDKPQIRPVEPIPAQQDGKIVFALRDPLGFADGIVAVPPPVMWMIQFFDGQHTRRDIQTAFYRQFTQFLSDEQIDRVIDSLDQALLLESDRFREHLRRVKQEFDAAPARAFTHAGLSYPDSPDELRATLEGFYVHPDGPGALPDFAVPDGAREIKAIAAPHIDLRSGGPCFAHAYHALSRAPRPDLFVILGTGHAGLAHCFAATRKDFDTPLGPLKTDADFIDRLAARFGADELFADELVHQREHVIEFQTLFLRHLYGAAEIRIAPILCSYSYLQLDEPAFATAAASIRKFAAALRETIGETPARVCVIASVDLAHIGPRYGDEAPIPQTALEANARADQRLLERLAAWDQPGFLALIRDEQDARRICGFPCLHTLLGAVDATEGQMLSYDVTAVDNNGSYVSFASAIFH